MINTRLTRRAGQGEDFADDHDSGTGGAIKRYFMTPPGGGGAGAGGEEEPLGRGALYGFDRRAGESVPRRVDPSSWRNQGADPVGRFGKRRW